MISSRGTNQTGYRLSPISCPLPSDPAFDHQWTGEIQDSLVKEELELDPESLSWARKGSGFQIENSRSNDLEVACLWSGTE